MTLKNFHQTSSSNNSLLVLNNSCSSNKDQKDFANDEVPPAIPQKTKRKTERHPSPYDNVQEEKLGKFIPANFVLTKTYYINNAFVKKNCFVPNTLYLLE